MKKVIILTYFFPPCNLTASQRAYGWAKYLNKNGYYPIIITRAWDIAIHQPEDALKKSGNKLIIKKEDGFEVHYLPYRPSFRDRLFTMKKQNTLYFLLRKIATFIELLSYGLTSFFISYKNVYSYTRNYLKSNTDIMALIVTANPFVMFRFGYLLHKEFNIKWIADYRDDWNTDELRKAVPTFSLQSLNRNFERKNELKWVSTASIITSVSDYYTSKISNYVNVKGKVLLNGYIKEDVEFSDESLSTNCFTIVYNGSLYDSQPVEIILESVKELIQQHPSATIQLLFIGTGYDPVQEKRIRLKAIQLDMLKNIEISERMPRKEVLKIQNSAHVLLMIAHHGKKGIPSSKLYEYLLMGKPIISFPADEDIIDETLRKYNLGTVCNSKEEIINALQTLFHAFEGEEYSKFKANQNYVKQFSREHQTKLLAEILDQL